MATLPIATARTLAADELASGANAAAQTVDDAATLARASAIDTAEDAKKTRVAGKPASAAAAPSDTFDFVAPARVGSEASAQCIESAPTIASPLLGSGVPLGALSAAPGRQSTVLPRVEIVGDEPRLVHNDRARYEDLAQLGEGGMGEVRKVRDNDIGRTVAVKRLKKEVRSASVLVRFMEEIRTVGRLEHPNIVPIHDVGMDEQGDFFFVMKYFDGETLESIIEKLAAGDASYHAMYPFERRMEIFEGILEAVNYAHAHGIIHRDIKPANIMVGRYGEVMVMDWGIARRIRDDDGPDPRDMFPAALMQEAPRVESSDSRRRAELFRTRAGALVGTPAYMSPEQARGEPLDERSDIYSLCVLLHELLSLTHYLQDAQDLEQVLDGVKNRMVPLGMTASSQHQPVVPGDLGWFVRKGVAKNPADRYPSVHAMIERLRRRKEGYVPIQCQITFLLSVSNLFRRLVMRNPMLVTIAMAATVVLFIGLALKALLW